MHADKGGGAVVLHFDSRLCVKSLQRCGHGRTDEGRVATKAS